MADHEEKQRKRSNAGFPAAAQRSLDQIAAALGMPTALIAGTSSSAEDRFGEVSFLEAAELLRAFIQIGDPRARQRCLAIVQETAGSQRSARR
ncbi:hypothetical protein [Methylobacterium planeticum]|uniref:Uncharacterized protein n=1 Tax=Methylobacterium planeticum TaxID=2615211 RepID=A0A6N6MNR1_9HYPH|nr:hypothetical protein [Methylobacterium planeticum]KAB1072508.1 hypothetical protein F6X51_16160 [Methylobacterium planeticum]